MRGKLLLAVGCALVLSITGGVARARGPIGPSLMDQLRYGFIDTVMLVEVPQGPPTKDDPVTGPSYTGDFRLVEMWRGKGIPATFKAQLSGGGGCVFDFKLQRALRTPGNKFIFFSTSANGFNPVKANFFEAKTDQIQLVKRMLWKTDNAVGKSLDDVLKEAAAKGNVDAKAELELLKTPNGAYEARSKYPEDLQKTVPSSLHGTVKPEIFISKKIWDLEAQVDKHPGNRDLLKERAPWYMEGKMYHKAVSDYTALIGLGEKLHKERAQAYLYSRRFGDAIKDYTTVLSGSPASVQIAAYADRARAYYGLKNFEKARADIQQSLTLAKKNSDGYPDDENNARVFLAGCIDYKLGKYSECAQRMHQLIKAEWGNGDAYAWRALSDSKLKKTADFRADCAGMLKHSSTLGFDEQTYLLERDSETHALFVQQEELALEPLVRTIKKIAASYNQKDPEKGLAVIEKEFAAAGVAASGSVAGQWKDNKVQNQFVMIIIPFKVDSKKVLNMLAEMKPEPREKKGDRQQYACKTTWGYLTLEVFQRPDGFQTIESIGLRQKL